MRRLFIWLLPIIPTVLAAQKDNPRKDTDLNNAAKCYSWVAEPCYHNVDTISLSVLLKYPMVMENCGVVWEFCASLSKNGVCLDKVCQGGRFSDEVMNIIKGETDDFDLKIVYVYYYVTGSNKRYKKDTGFTIHVIVKKKPGDYR